MYFIFILFFLAVAILVFIPAVLLSVIRTVLSLLGITFGSRRRGRASSSRTSSGANSAHSGAAAGERRSAWGDNSRKKLFDKDEGEYVDFVEIKEDK